MRNRCTSTRSFLVSTAAAVALLAGSASVAVQAGTWMASLVVLDFSTFPEGVPMQRNATDWNAQGWSKGMGCLRLLYSGASVWLTFRLDEAPADAQLTMVHRSAYAPDCPMSGCAPVTIVVNEHTITYDYAPLPLDTADGWGTDVWPLSGFLREGDNRVRIGAGPLCSVYELRKMAIEIPELVGPDIVAHQFTRRVQDNRPMDRATSFSPSDSRATLWLQVTERAREHWIEWTFYNPWGEAYFRTARSADRYNWGWIDVDGARAAALPGTWRVDVTIDGVLQLRAYFRIAEQTSSQQPPTCGLAPSQAEEAVPRPAVALRAQ